MMPVRRFASFGSKQINVPSMRRMVISSRRRSNAERCVSSLFMRFSLSFVGIVMVGVCGSSRECAGVSMHSMIPLHSTQTVLCNGDS